MRLIDRLQALLLTAHVGGMDAVHIGGINRTRHANGGKINRVKGRRDASLRVRSNRRKAAR
jgi:hypothetical protein